ncbi:MAG: hypothetical protein ACO3SP_09565, partial [Ilumatobacteraceae bacterium]
MFELPLQGIDSLNHSTELFGDLLLNCRCEMFGGPAAGILMGLATAAAIAGRTMVGWLMPQGRDRRLVDCLSHVVQI